MAMTPFRVVGHLDAVEDISHSKSRGGKPVSALDMIATDTAAECGPSTSFP